MSTILKALRRLEQEKSERVDRPLAEAVASAVPAPSPSPSPSRSWPMVAGITVGVIALGAAAFAALEWRRSGEATEPIEIAAAVPEKAEAKPAPAPPARAKSNSVAAKRRERRARNSRPTDQEAPRREPTAVRELPPQALSSDVAVVERSAAESPSGRTLGAPPLRSRRPAAVNPTTGPNAPAQGEIPLVDLSDIEALAAAVRSGRSQIPGVTAASPQGTQPTAAPPPTPGAPAADSRAPASAPKAAPTPAPIKVAAARPTPEPTPSRTSVRAPEPGPSPKTAPPPQPKPEAVEVAVARPAPKRARAPAPVAKPDPKPEPKPVVEPAPTPPPRVARKTPPRPAAPAAPKVHVARTVWHPDASKRTAFVEFEDRDEMVELHEGDAIGVLLVTKIAPTGVTFDNRGHELYRRVGAR